jgi:hypothetical protein
VECKSTLGPEWVPHPISPFEKLREGEGLTKPRRHNNKLVAEPAHASLGLGL